MKTDRSILLTGATGYVGGRLLPQLLAAGHHVRCLTRHPEMLRERVEPVVDVAAGDVLDRASLDRAFAGIDTIIYLVHSMGGKNFIDADRTAAENTAAAAAFARVRRIIYLGGLGDDKQALSPHLKSRHEVGNLLKLTGVQVIEFRASIIIGSGSLSFELVRALVERLPIMVTPKWVSLPAQPVAINDVLAYLLVAVDRDGDQSEIFEIGGSDVASYQEIMKEYARQRGLRRIMLPVPVLTPYLSSLWLGLVTPVFARIGRKLVESIRHSTIVTDSRATDAFAVTPCGLREAIAMALRNEDQVFAASRWSDAVSSTGAHGHSTSTRLGNRLLDRRDAVVAVPPVAAFAPIRRIGGANGWYYATFLWKLRGFLDLIVGGVGMRRGRCDPERLRVGDVIDCWRVERYEVDRLLRLRAEMQVWGRAWLEFEIQPCEEGSRIIQTAMFDPQGLSGLVYWYLVTPLHAIVFTGMLRGIANAAQSHYDDAPATKSAPGAK